MLLGSVEAEQLGAPNSNSGISDQQSVGSNPPVGPLVSLSKTPNHCFILQWDVKPCCVMHLQKTSAQGTEKGFTPVLLAVAAECARARALY